MYDVILEGMPYFLALNSLITVILFLRVCKINKSFFNSMTIRLCYDILVQTIPLIINSFNKTKYMVYSEKTLSHFIITIFIHTIFTYMGYFSGFKKTIKLKLLYYDVNKFAINTILLGSIALCIVLFLIVAALGAGVYQWIFHTRTAYIEGRSEGVGAFYSLWRVSLVFILVALLIKHFKYKKNYFAFIVLFIACSFTGSKGFLLGMPIYFLFCYDVFEKRISFKYVLIFFLIGFVALMILLGEGTIVSYGTGDLYDNYLELLEEYTRDNLSYYKGLLTVESSFWNMIPRRFFPNKPYVYGSFRLVAHFYGEGALIRAITPSFTSLGMYYAEFGIWGVAIFSFISGWWRGIVERSSRSVFWEKGPAFIPLFLIAILFFVSAAQVGFIYLSLITVVFILFFEITTGGRKIPNKSLNFFRNTKKRCVSYLVNK